MNHHLAEIKIIAQSPADFLRSTGQVFAVFDERTQDSGNISYGVLTGDRRFFVKRMYHPTLVRFIEDSDDRIKEKNSAFVEQR
jgi:hypothetical protein